MKLYIVRHGETELNDKKLMQGITDSPLNNTGIQQAETARDKLKDIYFDAVISSPLDRALTTAEIISGCDRESIIKDSRITEVNFGKYEKIPYKKLGIKMQLYWMFPERHKAPYTVEKLDDIIDRCRDFLADLYKKDYKNVLVVSHGNTIRALLYLTDNHNKSFSETFIKNCEIRIVEI